MATTAESVAKAEKVLENLKAEAQAAHEAEDAFLMGIFTELIAVCSPIVNKAISRQLRESRARINADHKALRAKMREAKETERR